MILGGSVAWGHVRGRPIDPATTRQLVNPIPVAIEALMECCEMTPKNRRMKNPRAERKGVPPFLLMLLPLLCPTQTAALRCGPVRRIGSARRAQIYSFICCVSSQTRGPRNLEGRTNPPAIWHADEPLAAEGDGCSVVIRTAKSAMQAPPMKERVSYFLLSPTGRGTGGGGNRQR